MNYLDPWSYFFLVIPVFFYCCLLKLWWLSVTGQTTLFYSTRVFRRQKDWAQLVITQALFRTSVGQWHCFQPCPLPSAEIWSHSLYCSPWRPLKWSSEMPTLAQHWSLTQTCWNHVPRDKPISPSLTIREIILLQESKQESLLVHILPGKSHVKPSSQVTQPWRENSGPPFYMLQYERHVMSEEHKRKEFPILPVGHCVTRSSIRWPVLKPVNGLVF